MNYYIDFDNTLYNTNLLKEKMLNSIAEIAKNQQNIDILQECNLLFTNDHIYDIYKLADYICNKYNLNLQQVLKTLDNVILNGSDFTFNDSIPFLEKLHNLNHNIFLLTYSNNNLKYQTLKILGSGLINYFDALYITSTPKYELDIDYKNGIFIDDNPKDLLGLYSKSAKKVIRLKRAENKYSLQNLENCNIDEYINFIELGGQL